MAEGQFLGIKGAYVYVDDSARSYVIRRDQTLATLPGTNLRTATTADANLTLLPRGFEPRGVYWQGELNGRIVRKFIVCGTPIGGLYENSGSTDLTVDNIPGVTTGKRGEKASFIRLALAP